jgi:hypothetical protein
LHQIKKVLTIAMKLRDGGAGAGRSLGRWPIHGAEP